MPCPQCEPGVYGSPREPIIVSPFGLTVQQLGTPVKKLLH